MKLFFYQQLFILLFSVNLFIIPQSQLPEKFKSEALQLMDYGRYGEAIDILNKYVSSIPTDAEGFNLRGICYEKRSNYEYAVYDFRTAKKLKPEDKEINSNLNRAISNWYKILFNKIEGHKREIAINPNLAKNYLEIGKCYKHLGEWREAEIWYDLYLEKEPASADEIIRYSEILAKNNQLAKGEKILKTYSEKFPDDHRLLSRYGYFLLWMGKNKLAIDAFNKSLKIRPFFKEAMDGLDLAKGKGYIYSINDTTVRYNYGIAPEQKEYIIDKYFRLLKHNPNDDNLRYKLIEELINANRYEEAKEELKKLSPNLQSDQKFYDISQKIRFLSNSFYSDKINYYEDLLSIEPKNTKAMLELAKFYSYKQEYVRAVNYYQKYLSLNPSDKEVEFLLAQVLMWQNNLCDAKKILDSLIKSEPNNLKYNLFAAKLNYWLNGKPEETIFLFNRVLNTEPLNYEALTGLANIYISSDDVENLEVILPRIAKIDSTSDNYKKIVQEFLFLKEKLAQRKLNANLEEARILAANKNYTPAIKLFNEYLSNTRANTNVISELADLYYLNNQKEKAVLIYKEFLAVNDDYEIRKKLAKLYLWAEDSSLALQEFIKLNSLKPDDIETKIFLGDAYLQNNQSEAAKRIYEDLLKQSPNSYLLKTRLNWIGGTDKFSFATFPTYIQLIPRALYFTDNKDFKYSNLGVGFDLGITSFLSLGFSGARGELSSNDDRLRFNQLKGIVYFNVNQVISGSAAFGKTYFVDRVNSDLFEFNLSVSKKNVYSLSAFANYSDAAFILYSPYLVEERIKTNHLGITGSYKFKNKLMVLGKYQYFDLSDENSGNQLQLRLGKEFESDLSAGYEYFYFDFQNTSQLYWSPKNFESHSLWADWILFNDDVVKLSLGGKAGLIPENDYLLSEFYAEFDYLIIKSLLLQTRFTTGSSFRSGSGYRSNSVSGSIVWNL